MDKLFLFLEANKLYVVLFISLSIWFSIFIFLLRIDKRIKEYEDKIFRKERKDDPK